MNAIGNLANAVLYHCLLEEPSQRILISISGIPGSGKTTIAAQVVANINSQLSKTGQGHRAVVLPMDGFHLTRAQLSALAGPSVAHGRRGAPFTFNLPSLVDLMFALRQPVTSESTVIFAPSFDHATKDPKEHDIPIRPVDRIVICEGNYFSLRSLGWKTITDMFHERWFLHVDRESARERLIVRHLAAGIANNAQEAAIRVENNDLPNGDFIIANSERPHRVILGTRAAAWLPTEDVDVCIWYGLDTVTI